MAFAPGQIVEGKYRIVRLLGEGGMGAVYEGENTAIARRVAIKILHGDASTNEDAVRRFEREAQAAGRIGSEHIVDVLDLGTLATGERFLVMEYLDGESLHERIAKQGRLPARAIAPLALQLLDGLAAAHDAGIIHRDLKPENVFLVRGKGGGDLVKLLDFGISKFSALSGEGGAFSMTRTGSVMGTPFYMSPEQARGEKQIDVRVDVYAVGVILFEALTGQVPFSGDNFNELLFKIVLGAPPDVAALAPETPPGFVEIVKKAMARDADQRFPTARELAVAIDAWMAGAGVLPTTTMGSASSAGRLAVPASARAPRPKTPSAWGNETPAVPPTRRVPVAALAAAGAVALLALGGVAWVAMKPAAPAPDASSAAVGIVVPTTATATAAAVAPAASAAPVVAPPVDSAATPAASAPAAALDAPPKKPAPAQVAPVAKPAPKPAAPAATPGPAATAGGRRIRTEL